MKRYFLIVLVFTVVSINPCLSQKIATLEVELTKTTYGADENASVNLDNITFLSDTILNLIEVQGTKKTSVPFQIENGEHRILHWIVKTDNEKIRKHVYELVKATPSKYTSIGISKKEGALTFESNTRNLLRYQFETVYPPQGIDTAFRRSGFIHPLWTPHGQSLTRIQAPDHYHHYGLWNPWTHVLFEGDTVDFWNLKDKKGTVRFAKFVSVTNGPVYGEFKALHEHVAFKKNGTEKIALNELQTVRVYQTEANQEYYVVDIIIQMNCASESLFKILEYRYAGLGWRATEKWNQTNSEVLTSEGKTRKEADGTLARWCIVQGALDNDYGGAVMMSYPSNYNHPEPLRIWPESTNKGEMFAMFAPTKTKDWLLMPGNTYTLKYRFIVFNGHFTKEKAESAWQYYNSPPKIIIKTN